MVDDFLMWLRAAGRPETTIYLRGAQLRRAGRRFDLMTVTTDEFVQWLGRPGWSVETRRSHRAALVTFFGWAVRSGRRGDDPSLGLPRVAPAQHLARPAPDDVIEAALAAADPRLWLMLTLMARHGLRRGEVARVHRRDLVRDLLGWSLMVRGKGGRDRVIPLSTTTAEALRLRGDGWAFPGAIDGHLSPARVGELVSEALPQPWTAHCLRHRFATVTWSGSRDLLAVQELLGHAKPETTRGYVRAPSDALRAVAELAA